MNFGQEHVAQYLNRGAFERQNLTQMKEAALKTQYPSVEHNHFCTVMLMINLAEPEWLNIKCGETLLQQITCKMSYPPQQKNNQSHVSNKLMKRRFMCSRRHILKNRKCYSFVWHAKSTLCHLQDPVLKHQNLDSPQYFQFLFDGMKSKFPPILGIVWNNCSLVQKYHYEKHLTVFDFRNTTIPTILAAGFVHFVFETNRITSTPVVMMCRSGTYILFEKRCNGHSDCPSDNSDEIFCNCNQTEKDTTERQCRHLKTKRSFSCGPFFYMTRDNVCVQFVGHHQTTHAKSTKQVICSYFEKSRNEMSGPQIMTDTSLCGELNQVHCGAEDSQCFQINEMCTFTLNKCFELEPCKNGGHLENCTLFECNAHFKCEAFYCIPWEYVCDDKRDCPSGDDEMFGLVCEGLCTHMYKCQNTQTTCIHLGNLCDSQQNCPFNDDELYCKLHLSICPFNCFCLGFAVSCLQVEFHFESQSQSFVSIHVANSKLRNIQLLSNHFPMLFFLHIVHCDLVDVCLSSFPHELIHVDFSYNLVSCLVQSCFESLPSLTEIFLMNNRINHVEHHSFANLQHLQLLSLSGNPLTTFTHKFFHNCPLKAIQILNISFPCIEIEDEEFVQLNALFTEFYQICCAVRSAVTCTAKRAWYQSCSDLLPHKLTGHAFVTICVLCFALNVVSVISQALTFTQNKAFSVSVISINIGDVLCSIFLATIRMAHLFFSGTFVVHETMWRSGAGCIFAFSVLLLFSIGTPLLLLFLSLSRLMVVLHPFDTHFKRPNFVCKSLACLTGLSCLVTITTGLYVKLQAQGIPSFLCLPFEDFTDSLFITKAVTHFVAITQILCSAAMIVIHTLLAYNVKKSTKNIRTSKSSDNSFWALLSQLGVFTVFNLVCWWTTNSVFISTSFMSRYPAELLIWTTVAVMPLESIANPLILLVVLVRKTFCLT